MFCSHIDGFSTVNFHGNSSRKLLSNEKSCQHYRVLYVRGRFQKGNIRPGAYWCMVGPGRLICGLNVSIYQTPSVYVPSTN